jgi:ATP-binding cassette, subfamily G (WHITE), member 2, PDR
LTYFVDGMVATGLHGRPIECSATEINQFNAPSGMTCGEYMKQYLTKAPGKLLNPEDTSDCRYCALSTSDQFIAGSDIQWDQRWRNSSIMWSYIVFNVFTAVMLYYVFRVRKWDTTGKKRKIAKAKYWVTKGGHYIRALFIGHLHKVKKDQNNRVL